MIPKEYRDVLGLIYSSQETVRLQELISELYFILNDVYCLYPELEGDFDVLMSMISTINHSGGVEDIFDASYIFQKELGLSEENRIQFVSRLLTLLSWKTG